MKHRQHWLKMSKTISRVHTAHIAMSLWWVRHMYTTPCVPRYMLYCIMWFKVQAVMYHELSVNGLYVYSTMCFQLWVVLQHVFSSTLRLHFTTFILKQKLSWTICFWFYAVFYHVFRYGLYCTLCSLVRTESELYRLFWNTDCTVTCGFIDGLCCTICFSYGPCVFNQKAVLHQMC